MRLIRAADYAVRVLVYLARKETGARATREEIVEATAVPSAFLKRIIQTLVRSHLVVAQRGARGGCSLALPADQISVLRVIESIDSPLEISKCIVDSSACPRAGCCAFRGLLSQLQRDASALLTKMTIADLASDTPPDVCWPEPIQGCD